MVLTAFLTVLAAAAPAATQPAPPNIVLVVADDLGWGDLAVYGHPTVRTPHLDRLAVEGQRWTSFYSGAPYCTASRAGLLTGRLPVRSGMASESRTVLFPDSVGGLPQSEITIPELLKIRGYATAMMGKWHLGHLPPYQPEKHGFDLYFGIPYSNDMDAVLPDGPAKNALIRKPGNEHFNVPVFSGGEVVERPARQETLTRRYIDRAEAFIRANKGRPFFLYLAHHLPHVPLFAHDEKAGHGPHGAYADVVEEIDDGVGRLRAVLAELVLERNTLLVFTSDNGPWLAQKDLGGSSGPFRDGKGTTFEGGVRVPALFVWPGTVKPDVVGEMGAFFDLLPTFAALAGAALPAGRVLDGGDLTPVLKGTGASPRREYFYYRGSTLQAVRSGPFKAHFVTREEGWDQSPKPIDPPWLYDLDTDPAERYDLAAERPEVVAAIRKLAEDHKRGVEPAEDQIARRAAQSETDWALSVAFPRSETPLPLFNGHDLAGWEGQLAKYWSVEDGTIRGANDGEVLASTYLFTARSYRRFRLLFEVKQTRGERYSTMHSAVAVLGERLEEKGDPFSFKGPLLMFCGDWGIWDANRRDRVYPAGHRGGWQHPSEKIGDWNQIEVLVVGDRLRMVNNGQLVVDFTDQPAMLKASPIGLQVHSNDRPQEFRFRGLVLAENPEDRLFTLKPEQD